MTETNIPATHITHIKVRGSDITLHTDGDTNVLLIDRFADVQLWLTPYELPGLIEALREAAEALGVE